MLDDRLKHQIEQELGELDELCRRYADLLQSAGEGEPPDLVQVTALGSVLHSFYSGLERIFENVAKGVDGSVPEGDRWHTDLLLQMARATARRSRVVTEDMRRLLQGYLAFRHYYRHSYSHSLEWSQMRQLVRQLQDTWKRVRVEVEGFVARETGVDADEKS